MSRDIEEYWTFVQLLWMQYWPIIVFVCIVLITVSKHGLKRIFCELLKQLTCMMLLIIVGICGYVILTKQWKEIKDNTFTFRGIIEIFYYGNYTKLLNDGNVMIPFSNFLFSFGFLAFILGLLYKTLPIDLIPDFIPFIGLYDNYLASFVSYLGLLVCVIAILLSVRYYENIEKPSQTTQDTDDLNIVTESVYFAFEFVYNVANNTFG
eukprot:161162_1